MKKILYFIFSFYLFSAMAETTVTVEGETFRCEKTKDLTLHCSNNGKKLLVKKTMNGPLALLKNGEAPALLKYVSKIIEEGNVLFMADAPASSTRASARHFALFSPKDSWLKGFITYSAEQYPVDKLPFKVEMQEGSAYCQKGESRQEQNSQEEERRVCAFYSCESGENRYLAFVPQSGANGEIPHLLKLNGEKTELLTSGFKIFDRDLSETDPLYTMQAQLSEANLTFSENSGLPDEYFIPKKYLKNKTALEYLTDPIFAKGLKAISDSCSGKNAVTKMINERDRIAKKMTDDLARMKFSHYLTLTDGNLIGFLINGEKAGELGCLHDGMILSNEALNHLEYLNKAKVKAPSRYLSENEVQDLFNEAKAMSDIPFGYKKDGCYARAHIMARRFMDKGIEVEKAWIKGFLQVPGTSIEWNYHVAPAINVKNNKGEIKKYIIDPSLTDKAVPVEEWVKSMGKNPNSDVLKTGYPFPENIASYNKAALSFSKAEIYSPDNNENRTPEGDMAHAYSKMAEYSDALKEEQQ